MGIAPNDRVSTEGGQLQLILAILSNNCSLAEFGASAMSRYSIDLPYFVSLAEGDYEINIGEEELRVSHSVVQQDTFDPRIGDIESGSFGFVRDRYGVLRYSNLSVEVDDETLDHLGTVLTGSARPFLDSADLQGKARIALAVFNRFLDKYRVATRNVDVKSVVPWDLALMRLNDGRNTGTFSLYGGGFTLPPLPGLIPESHEKVLANFANPYPAAEFELAAVDALRMVEDGQTLESIVTSIGAVEAALDLFFARTWRLSDPRVLPTEAATWLGMTNPRDIREIRTIEDVLELAGVRRKVKAFAKLTGISDDKRDNLFEAIDLRNLTVHGGVRVPVKKAKPHVRSVVDFVLAEIVPRVMAECPNLQRAELLYACEEALGSDCSPHLQPVVDAFLTARGLSAKLYNQRFTRKEMSSERFGDTLIVKITFGDFDSAKVNLFIAQALLYHYLERRGDVAQARAADDPSVEDRRPFFEIVASALTRTVWNAAINRHLREMGFDELVQRTAEAQAADLGRRYQRSYTEPRFEELSFWIDYLDLARVAAELPSEQRESLVSGVARVSPRTARRALAAIPALEQVEFDDLKSIREALIRVHDAHESIMASASIFDPITRERYGFGLRMEDLGLVRIRPPSA